MLVILSLAQIISILAFLFYGYLCVFTFKLVPEFERYGLSHMRIITGSLEIAGAFGILIGLYFPILAILASAGLALMMLCAIYVRIKIKDPILVILPAGFLLCVNALIFYCIISTQYK